MKIVQKSIKFLTVLAIALCSFHGFASDSDKKSSDQNDGGIVDTKTEVEEYILHHIQDSHDFTLFSYTNDAGERKHVGFPLPVIVYTSEGIKTFMSSAFHHDDSGHEIVTKGDVKLTKIHGKIYELDATAQAVSFVVRAAKRTDRTL